MKTTVTLHPRTILFLKELTQKAGVCPSEILRLCLFKWFCKKRAGVRYRRRSVAYQLADGIRYKRMHVFFSVFEYESFIDARKLLKRSVSSIATEAIYEFAEKICENLSKEFIDLDTYIFPPYTVMRVPNKKYIKWELSWFPHAKKCREKPK